MTYYKFAERNVDSQINWAEVGKNMTDMLSNEVKIREEKKAALDQASRDYAQKLTDAPMGDNELLNNFTLDVADSAKQSLLMFDNLLKSGQLNPNDYLKSVQNLNTGTENLFNLSKEYNAQYAETMKRMQDGDSQQLEQDTFASLEGYAMLGNHKAYINPTDGTISLGEMIPGPNGVMQMGKPVSVSDLRNRITQKYDKYDVEKRVGEVIGSIQAQTKLIEIQNRYGISIVEEDDFFKKEGDKYVYPEAGQFLENTIKGIKAIDTNVTSILTENVVLGVNGEQFMYVQKQGDDWVEVRTGEVVKEKKENHIETSINPRSGKREFNFTKEQEEQVDNYLKEQILARAKSEQRFKRAIEPPKPSAQEIRAKGEKESLENNINRLADLYYGDAGDINVSEIHFRDLVKDPTFGAPTKVQKTREGIKISFLDKEGNTISKNIPFGESFEDFVIQSGPLMLGESNIEGKVNISDFIRKNEQGLDLPFNPTPGKGAQEIVEIPSDTFVINSEETTRTNLEKLFSTTPGMTGYKVREANVTPYQDEIVIEDTNGNEVERFELDETFSAADYIERLQKIIDAAQGKSVAEEAPAVEDAVQPTGPINYAEK